jgi:PAS domain S-box-containing protein
MVLWGRVPHATLVVWNVGVVAMVVARLELRRRYHLHRARREDARFWGRWFTAGSALAGALWGYAGWAFLASSSPVAQTVVLFVIGGMIAGAAGTLSAWSPAYFAFVAPAVAPTFVRLLLSAEPLHSAMAAMIAVYAGALTLVARNVNRTLTTSQLLRFERQDLLDELAKARQSLEAANLMLQSRVEETLRDQRTAETKLSQLIAHSDDGFLSLDGEGIVADCNPAVERISGSSREEIVGNALSALDWFGRAGSEHVAALLDRVLASGTTSRLELDLAHSARHVELVLGRVELDHGTIGVQAILRDLSDRTKADRARAELEEQLRQAQKLELVGQLAGGVAHDFNNLLTVILSNSDAMLASMADAPPRPLKEIRQAATRAADLTRQLLAFSRRQVLQPRALDLSDVVRRVKRMLERLIGEDITLELELDREPVPVTADRTQLEQVIVNLVTNARDAMPKGGSITIGTANTESESGERECELTVTDTGDGMDEATRQRIFEPFFTTKDASRGTGLGLATVLGIVTQSGGRIQVASSPGRGARFSVRLQRTELPAAQLESLRPSVEVMGGSETILYVEDDHLVRHATQRILARAGYRVLIARDGEEALAVAERHPNQISLLLSDIVMPKLRGPELAARLRSKYPSLRVVFVSGYPGDALPDGPDSAGGTYFLQKPFTPGTLTAQIRRAIESTLGADRRFEA